MRLYFLHNYNILFDLLNDFIRTIHNTFDYNSYITIIMYLAHDICGYIVYILFYINNFLSILYLQQRKELRSWNGERTHENIPQKIRSALLPPFLLMCVVSPQTGTNIHRINMRAWVHTDSYRLLSRCVYTLFFLNQSTKIDPCKYIYTRGHRKKSECVYTNTILQASLPMATSFLSGFWTTTLSPPGRRLPRNMDTDIITLKL